MTATPRTTTDPAHDRRSRWGRSTRLGGGSRRLILVSLATGVVVALLIGAAAAGLAAGQATADARFPMAMGAIMAAGALPVGAALTWALLVDRSTVRGAIRNPEESVEGRWYERATSGAFHDLLVLLGVGGSAAILAGWAPPLNAVVLALIAFMTLSTGLRYLFLKRRG